MAYIFLDESGHFNKNQDGKFFVIGSFTVGNPKRTAKSFRGWCQTKFPKKTRWQSEIKFSDHGLTEELRQKTLKFISRLDVRINFSYFLRANISKEYWHHTCLHGGLLYTNIIGETIEMFLPTTDLEFRVFCDQRQLHGGVTKQEFRKILKARLLPQLPSGSLVQIEMIDSTTSENIQIADWLAGAIGHYLEKKPFGEEYFKILKNNILDLKGKQMFEGI